MVVVQQSIRFSFELVQLLLFLLQVPHQSLSGEHKQKEGSTH